MKKNAAVFLVAILLLTLMISCSQTEDNNNINTTTTQNDSVDQIDDIIETEGYDSDDLPDDLDFGGQEISFLVWSDAPNTEFYLNEQTGEIVDDAVYNRNLTVTERLNVTFKYTEEPGNNANRTTFVNYAKASIMAGDGAFDIIAGYSMTSASLAYNNLVINLLEVDYLNFDMPWWPDSLINEAKIGDKLYFASGDISTNLLYMMYGVFFNKLLIADYNLEDPYQIVLNGEWTIDKMSSMAKDVYMDLNGNDSKDENDQFGFVTHTTFIDPFFYGSGLLTVERDEDGIPQFSSKYNSEKTQLLLEKLCNMFFVGNDSMLYTDYDPNALTFKEGRSLFIQHETQYAIQHLRDSDVDYGFVPIAKWDETQENHITCLSFPYSLYTIPIDVQDTSVVGAVLECIASESYRQVSPVLFEIALKVKYSNDDTASQMYDIIRDGINFDFGRIFNDSMSSYTYSLFRNAVANNTTDWASIYAKNETSLQKMLANVVDTLMQ